MAIYPETTCGQFDNSRTFLNLFWNDHSLMAFISEWLVLTSQLKVGHVYRGPMHSGRWHSPYIRRTRVHPSFAYKQNLLSLNLITEDNIAPYHSPVASSTTPSRARRCCGVSGNLARDTCDLSSILSRRFPMVLGDTTGATCTRISSLDAIRAATAAAQCFDLDVHVYYVAVQNLAYEYGNVSQNTADNSNTPPLHCVQNVQQSDDMPIQLPAGLQCDPVQMPEVVQQK